MAEITRYIAKRQIMLMRELARFFTRLEGRDDPMCSDVFTDIGHELLVDPYSSSEEGPLFTYAEQLFMRGCRLLYADPQRWINDKCFSLDLEDVSHTHRFTDCAGAAMEFERNSDDLMLHYARMLLAAEPSVLTPKDADILIRFIPSYERNTGANLYLPCDAEDGGQYICEEFLWLSIDVLRQLSQEELAHQILGQEPLPV